MLAKTPCHRSRTNFRAARLRVAAAIAGTLAFTAVGSLIAGPAFAHCDTMDGPVIADARIALAQGDIAPVLKWLKPEGEQEVREAFGKVLAIRGQGSAVRDLADSYFFETLVRVHRAGEGAPYTGLKRAGTPIDPAVEAADQALQTGSIEPVILHLTGDVTKGVKERFEVAHEAARHSGESVEAGREFVEAYVSFVHYVEGLHEVASSAAGHVHGDEGHLQEEGSVGSGEKAEIGAGAGCQHGHATESRTAAH